MPRARINIGSIEYHPQCPQVTGRVTGEAEEWAGIQSRIND